MDLRVKNLKVYIFTLSPRSRSLLQALMITLNPRFFPRTKSMRNYSVIKQLGQRRGLAKLEDLDICLALGLKCFSGIQCCIQTFFRVWEAKIPLFCF